MGNYIAQADVEARVSARVVRQILDDNRDGTADAEPIARLIADSESYVEEYAVGVYDLALLRACAATTLARLSIDVAVAFLKERFPSYSKKVPGTSWERVREELRELRLGERRLNIAGPPEPAANEGGVVDPGVPPEMADAGVFHHFGFGNTGLF